MQLVMSCVFALVLFVIVPTHVVAANVDLNDFVAAQFHVDKTTNPLDPFSTVLQSPTLSETLKLALAYFGVDPKVANVSVELAKRFTSSGGGNDITQHYYAPSGHLLCSAWVGVHSITGGARLSFIFDASGNIAIGMKTPAKGFTEGHQWIEGDIKVLWVKTSAQQGYQNQGICFKEPVAQPNERYQCGDVGNCKEYHLGHAFQVTATPGNYIVKP